MYGNQTSTTKKIGIGMMAGALLLGAALAAAQEPAPDKILSEWVGKEFTVETSTHNAPAPVGGKLTFVLDAEASNVVHLCTRNTESQSEPWRMDFAKPCGVTLTFTRGTRYCTVDDVKTGDAEALASCHRLRTHDVAMSPSKAKGAVERKDLVAFLVQEENGKQSMTILVDSPARVTGDDGVVVIKR